MEERNAIEKMKLAMKLVEDMENPDIYWCCGCERDLEVLTRITHDLKTVLLEELQERGNIEQLKEGEASCRDHAKQ